MKERVEGSSAERSPVLHAEDDDDLDRRYRDIEYGGDLPPVRRRYPRGYRSESELHYGYDERRMNEPRSPRENRGRGRGSYGHRPSRYLEYDRHVRPDEGRRIHMRGGREDDLGRHRREQVRMRRHPRGDPGRPLREDEWTSQRIYDRVALEDTVDRLRSELAACQEQQYRLEQRNADLEYDLDQFQASEIRKAEALREREVECEQLVHKLRVQGREMTKSKNELAGKKLKVEQLKQELAELQAEREDHAKLQLQLVRQKEVVREEIVVREKMTEITKDTGRKNNNELRAAHVQHQHHRHMEEVILDNRESSDIDTHKEDKSTRLNEKERLMSRQKSSNLNKKDWRKENPISRQSVDAGSKSRSQMCESDHVEVKIRKLPDSRRLSCEPNRSPHREFSQESTRKRFSPVRIAAEKQSEHPPPPPGQQKSRSRAEPPIWFSKMTREERDHLEQLFAEADKRYQGDPASIRCFLREKSNLYGEQCAEIYNWFMRSEFVYSGNHRNRRPRPTNATINSILNGQKGPQKYDGPLKGRDNKFWAKFLNPHLKEQIEKAEGPVLTPTQTPDTTPEPDKALLEKKSDS